MQNYTVKLQSAAFTSYRSQMAANSVDLDVAKKLTHELSVTVDLDSKWNVGLIVGASGSGKTTMAKKIFGDDCFACDIDYDIPVIEQFPESWGYDKCAEALIGIGLSQVPCWIRPLRTLSNGQQHRAIAALTMAHKQNFCVDEWTSVVDRTVAKAMSVCLGKHARKNDNQVVAVACHHDIIEWLDPDWIIDCNTAQYIDRRLLQRGQRQERLHFSIKSIDSRSWQYFSKYHYLSDKLPGGITRYYGLFHNGQQIGFQCFANYTPRKPNTKLQMHFNRTVIHPDYVGLGLGMLLIEATAYLMDSYGYDVRGKFSSVPIAKAIAKSPNWKLRDVMRFTPKAGSRMLRDSGFRQAVKSYSYAYCFRELPKAISISVSHHASA